MKKNNEISDWFNPSEKVSKNGNNSWRNYFADGGVKTIPNWARNVSAMELTDSGYPSWWLSTKELDKDGKQKHYNAIVNNMLDDGYKLDEIPMIMNDIIGYGENERGRVEFNPTLGFDKGDIDELMKNYNADNFADGGQYAPAIAASEQKYGIPSGLLYKVAKQESSFDPDIISGKRKSRNAKGEYVGATGLFQFMPETAKELGIDPTDPIQSTDAAGKYLSSLYKQTGSWEDALMAYNWGIGNVQSYKKTGVGKTSKGIPKETKDYVAKIMGKSPIGNTKYANEFQNIQGQIMSSANTVEQSIEEMDDAPRKKKKWIGIGDENSNDSEEDEYVNEEQTKELMKMERRNAFLDLVMQSMPQSQEDTWQARLFS